MYSLITPRYTKEMGTEWESAWDRDPYQAGDILEIRLACDQASSNEDIGLHYLKIELFE